LNRRLGVPHTQYGCFEEEKIEVEEGMQRVNGYQAEGWRRSCVHSLSDLSVVIMMVMGVRLNCMTLWSAAGGQQIIWSTG
jgi:hypothetical protein